MSQPQKVIKGSTETIETYPPILAQATGTPTARIGTPSVSIPTTGSTATVDSLSTDVSGDALAGRTEISVTSATWVRGRKYIATSTTGQVFPIISAQSGASTTLYLQEPLPTALLTGSTIVGYRLSIALTTAQTANIGDQCVVEWTAIIGGVSHVWMDDFAIVYRVGEYTLDHIALTRSSPFCKRLQQDSDADFSEMIDAAWRRYVQPALLAKGIRPELFVSRTVLEPAHIAACEHLAAQSAIDGDAQMREEKRREWSQALDLVLNSETLWIDHTDQSLTPPNPEAARSWTATQVFR